MHIDSRIRLKEKLVKILDYITEYSLYGLIYFIPISKAAIEIFFVLAFVAFILKKAINPDFKFLRSRANFFLLLFIVFSALSLFNSGPYLMKGFKALFFKWLEYIIIFLMIQDTVRNYKRARICLFILLGVSLLTGIDAFSQRFFGIEFLRQKSMIAVGSEPGLYAVTASFNHYNNFGAYLALVVFPAMGLLFSRQKGLYKVPAALLVILLIACLLLTFSRGSWLGFIGALVLMLVLSYRFGFSNIIFGTICVFLLFLLFSSSLEARARLIFQIGGDASRFAIWRGAWLMIKETPFLGKGLGTFMDYFPKYAPNLGVQYAHNCYLQIWAETGIFSLIGFLLFVSSILYEGIKKFRQNNDFVLLGLICGVFAFLIHSFFDTHFYSLQLAVLFWVSLGLICTKKTLTLK